jgi:hypothetical protein
VESSVHLKGKNFYGGRKFICTLPMVFHMVEYAHKRFFAWARLCQNNSSALQEALIESGRSSGVN